MKITILTTALVILSLGLFAQVSINSDSADPDGSVILDVKSTDKGLLPPRMTKAQRDGILYPAVGLLVFQTDETPGYYYYAGPHWIGITGSGTGAISASALIDCDGNAYPTINIGNQVWMAENLKVTHYRNGNNIPNETADTTWSNLTTGAYCWYNNNQSAYEKHGPLYNWHAVADSRGLCPDGWHVPTHAEWTTLTTYLGGPNVAGGKMKATSDLWHSPNTAANNSSSFSGLACGRRNYDGSFNYIVHNEYWWSSTESSSSSGSAWLRSLGYDSGDVGVYHNDKHYGFSVRCLRD
ncbi:MAG: hypothetical protein GY712_05595, partial [Oceanicoccus sp.]|uniref:fibrobacter succinogenes major paralogous domain-containing protein n=1 Tax=Oceanicoccus sp. TaxID=2691044 RepID=UPI00260DC2A9